MKNHHSYRLTDTGIRISTRKTKWMTSPKDGESTDLDSLPPAKRSFNSLFTNNFHAFLQCGNYLEAEEIMDAEGREEGD